MNAGTEGQTPDHGVNADHDLRLQLSAAIADVSESRAVIEQAKGMLMVIYGLEADPAFEVLRWVSQHHNVKLRAVAVEVTTKFVSLARLDGAGDKRAFDKLLHDIAVGLGSTRGG